MSDIRVDIKELLPIIKEGINANGTVKIKVTGQSMQPMVYNMRDTVTLKTPPKALNKYDVPLYVRDNGAVILHRVIKCEKDGSYTCRGDNQWKKEYGVKHSQIIAVVSEFSRNGKNIDAQSSFGYKLYHRTWPFFHHFKFLYKYIVKPFKKIKF